MFLFSKQSIGLDIADHTIEIIKLTKRGGGFKLGGLGRIELESGVVERGRIKDREKLAAALRQVMSIAKPKAITGKKIVFGLPESQVYTHVFLIDEGRLSKDELEDTVKQEARTSIPLTKDELVYSYKILSKAKGKTEILLVATSKEVLLEWQDFFASLKIEVEFYDIETLALFRDLYGKSLEKPVCVVDIGAATTNISIFDKIGLRYSYSVDVAGDAFTEVINKNLKKKDLQAAEVAKKKFDLKDVKNKKITASFLKQLKIIINSIGESIKYFQLDVGSNVEEIVLVGGSSQLKGLVEYFKEQTGLSVRLGASRLLESEVPLVYIEAVGLCLRDLNEGKYKEDPNFVFKIDKKQSGKKKDKAVKPVIVVEVEKDSSALPETEAEGASQEQPVEDLKESKVEKVNIDKDAEPLVEPEEVAPKAKKSSRKQIILLLIVLIVGFGLIGLAYTYKNKNKTSKTGSISKQATQYSQVQSFNLFVPIATAQTEYTTDRLKGRLVRQIIMTAEDENTAQLNSKKIVTEQLKTSESLWKLPVNISKKDQKNVYPITFEWLIFEEKEMAKLFLLSIDKINKKGAKYSLVNIQKLKVEKSSNVNIYYLHAKVTISLNELISASVVESKKDGQEAKTTSTKKYFIEINSNNVGWLNVRSGPGSSYDAITKINPGEEYELLEEKSGWQKINLTSHKEAWVSAQYTTKK